MQCGYCPRTFTKAEHWRRHERSHTGAKPFVCTTCKRAFGRQDSLLRHERLHSRTERRPESNSNGPASQQSIRHSPVSDGFPSADSALDFDFDLMWPDSHDLFQSLLSSSETPAQWQVPLGSLGTAPLTPESSSNRSDILEARPASIGTIPSGGSHQAVNDVSKMVASLSSSITTAVDCSSITSVFLDECLHMFFVRFIPVLPILHRGTFVFRECTQALLLNAIAIGSLYLGPKDSVAKGETLWRLAHTALSTAWQSLITHRGPHDACDGIQLVITALLSQLYGALSKNRAIRTQSQASHATAFFWARQCGMFECEGFSTQKLPAFDSSPMEKETKWRLWIAREIQQRALLALYMLDGLVALMTGDPACERHLANPLQLPNDEAAFNASTADEWLQHMACQPEQTISFRAIYQQLFAPQSSTALPTSMSPFAYKVLLEGLQSIVSDHGEHGEASLGTPDRTQVGHALVRLWESVGAATQLPREERLEVLLRWHSICLDNTVKTAALHRALCAQYQLDQHVWPQAGRRGAKAAAPLEQWARSSEARRALLHAAAIQDIVEQLPRGRAHAIHMPSALFAAAVVYAVFALGGCASVRLPSVVDWRVAVAGADAAASDMDARETLNYIQGEPFAGAFSYSSTRNLLYELNSMQKLFRCLYTQWGVAFDMEAVVDQWIKLCH